MVDISKALGSYAATALQGTKPGMDAREAAGPSFASVLQEATSGAIDQMKQAEGATAQAISGQTNLTDVVLAVNNAELTLQTVVTVRDKVINAYQEIMRMPM